MQEDMKRQEGEKCRKAGDILVAVFKLLWLLVFYIDPVWVFWCMALGCVPDVSKEVAVKFVYSVVIYSVGLLSKQNLQY
jgi:hypothetical protein